MKTLGEIAGYLTGTFAKEHSSEFLESERDNKNFDKSSGRLENFSGESAEAHAYLFENMKDKVEKKVVSIFKAPLDQTEKLMIPSDRKIIITDDKTGLSKAIADQLASVDIETVLVPPEGLADILKGKKDMPPAAGLIIAAGNEPAGKVGYDRYDDKFLRDAFALAKHFFIDLTEAAKKGSAIFATISRLDGAFGFKDLIITNPFQGGLAGLAKTAALEWKDVFCHAIDIAPDWNDNKEIAEAVVDELLNSDPICPVEVGLNPDGRYLFELESCSYPEGKIDIDKGEVVVITGGARGITASAARILARHAKPVIVLLGRSPDPSPEPDWMVSLKDNGAIKKAILENDFSNDMPSPILLEKTFKQRMANREILVNIKDLKNHASDVLYYSADVRDPERLKSVLNDVRSTYGQIRVIIHGSGVLEDRLITDKTCEQFETVFSTKVKGLRALLEATKKDDLKYLVLFSSITARMGNKGQVDYAMANEVLNKIAQQESFKRPDCRVISINWGPWDGGMVSAALKREFERNNIELIPTDAGALSLLSEMRGDKNAPVEVVIGAGINAKSVKNRISSYLTRQKTFLSAKRDEELSLAFKSEIDVDRFPILESHILDGKPVVPFALMSEWLGYGALHENPGLMFCGFDDLRLLNGIRLDHEKKVIRLMAGKAKKKGSVFEVDVEIRNGINGNKEYIHSRAKAILADRFLPPPLFEKSFQIDNKAYLRNIEEVYEKILFHGLDLRGIKEITGYSSKGMTARVSAAPHPQNWMAEPVRSRWISDPLILDSAFQMAIVWCFEKTGLVSLPSYCAGYRQYRNRFPDEGVTAIFEVKDLNNYKIMGEFIFLDKKNLVVASLTGYEAVMNTSLIKAFRNNDPG